MRTVAHFLSATAESHEWQVRFLHRPRPTKARERETGSRGEMEGAISKLKTIN
jgi:hypothetical protein